MVSGIAHWGNVNASSYDACEAARFTMYVSETLRAYPCSFMETAYGGVPVTKDNMIRIWRSSALFREIRKRLASPLAEDALSYDCVRGDVQCSLK